MIYGILLTQAAIICTTLILTGRTAYKLGQQAGYAQALADEYNALDDEEESTDA